MKNFQQLGNRLRLFPAASVAAGEVVVVGELAGVAFSNYDVADGDGVIVDLEGVYTLPKKTGAWTQGQPLYYDAAVKAVGVSDADGPLIGHAAEPATNDAAIGVVRLKG